VLFIVDGWVDGEAPPELDVMSWAELRELVASGDFDVQSHTHAMHYKTWHEDAYYAVAEVLDWLEDPVALERIGTDLRESRSVLAERLGEEPRYLAWPYGSATARTDSVARAAGFAGSFGLRFGRVGNEESSPMSLPRYAVTARTSPTFFARLLSAD
jgi:peptidoglycan/xylan/chitin deacetylase (PgdA/CDA1 family)